VSTLGIDEGAGGRERRVLNTGRVAGRPWELGVGAPSRAGNAGELLGLA
jgi:hypothetical protein